MKARCRVWLLLGAFLALGILGYRSVAATQQNETTTAQTKNAYVPNEVLVKFRPATADHYIVESLNAVQGMVITLDNKAVSAGSWSEKKADNRSFLGDQNLFRIQVPQALGSERAIGQLLEDPNIEYAERNYLYHANTDYFYLQWGLNNTGALGGTADADVDAPEAWNLFTGSSDITIAIIDSGINYDHPDLQANIWTNSGEIGDGKEDDNVDNDGNGLIDDWMGWDGISSTAITILMTIITSTPLITEHTFLELSAQTGPMETAYPEYVGTLSSWL